jgi:hypothetical protein
MQIALSYRYCHYGVGEIPTRARTCSLLPFAKVGLGLVIGTIQCFRRNTKATENFDGKVSKVRVPTKDRADGNEERGINGRHDHDGTNAIGPRTVFKAASNAKSFTDRRSYQLEMCAYVKRQRQRLQEAKI